MSLTSFDDLHPQISQALAAVRSRLGHVLSAQRIGILAQVIPESLLSGKMLRAKLALYLAGAQGGISNEVIDCAAAVELVHTASLLHDDVIDGGFIRRGAPAYWVEKGISGAVLMGDLLLCQAALLVLNVADHKLHAVFLDLVNEMVTAEAEQELVLRGAPLTWEDCVRNARRKTGPLFAFAALAGATSKDQHAALLELGHLAGTAYQLSDDILDAFGDPEDAGKTLRLDARRAKKTVVQAGDGQGMEWVREIESYLVQGSSLVAQWPALALGWNRYLESELRPAIQRNVAAVQTARLPDPI